MERSLYKTRVIVVTAIFLCVLTVLLLATFGFRRLQERRKKILALTNEYKFAIDNINENERQIRELESCNSSLDSLVKSLRAKNEELESQKRQIEAEYNQQNKNETDISVAVHLLEIKNVRDTFTKSGDFKPELWQKLFNAVMMVSPGLIDFLNTNNISINSVEYKVCMLIAAGFKPHEMADALFMSKQNVSSIRKRMYKRIFNKEDGTAKDFDKKIREFMQVKS
jgi:small-conductance mechanosensitive channel